MKNFERDIDNCFVDVDVDEIKIREVVKTPLSDEEKLDLLPKPKKDLICKFSEDGYIEPQDLFEDFNLMNGCELKIKSKNAVTGDVVFDTDWKPDTKIEIADAGKYKVTCLSKEYDLYDDFDHSFEAVEIKELAAKDMLDGISKKESIDYDGSSKIVLDTSKIILPKESKLSYEIDGGECKYCESLSELGSIAFKNARNYKIIVRLEGENSKKTEKNDIVINSKKIDINSYEIETNDLKFKDEYQSVLKNLPDLEENCKWQFYDVNSSSWQDRVDGNPKIKDFGPKVLKLRIYDDGIYKTFDEKEISFEVKEGELQNDILPLPNDGLICNNNELSLFKNPTKTIEGVEIEYQLDGKKNWTKLVDAEQLKASKVGEYKYKFMAKKHGYKMLECGLTAAIKDKNVQEIENVDKLLLSENNISNVYKNENQILFSDSVEKLPEGCKCFYKIECNDTEENVQNTETGIPYDHKNPAKIKNAGTCEVWQKIYGGLNSKDFKQKGDHNCVKIEIKRAQTKKDIFTSVLEKDFMHDDKTQIPLNISSEFSDLLGDCEVICSIKDENENIKSYRLNRKNLLSVSLKDAGLYKIKFSVVGNNTTRIWNLLKWR